MFTRRDGKPWEPEYLVSINSETCIGCGRCFKVCGRDVMHLKGLDEDGALIDFDPDEDEDDEEFERKIMVIVNAGNCIGCTACARVCPKSCQTHTPASKLEAA